MGVIQFLVEQSGNPSGFIGKLLLNTMDMAHGNVIKKALEPIRHDRSYSVLDIGCGSGYALKIMNSQFHDSCLHGTDISETCVREAELKNRKALHNNSFDIRLGNVATLFHESNSMDLVTAFQTHYFWPDIHQACREIQRVLKPNGLFILCGDLYKMKYHLSDRYQFIEEYPELLKEEGFSQIEIFAYHGFMIARSVK